MRAQQKATNAGFHIFGRNGLALFDYWEEGPRSFMGFATHNFPNAFWLNGPQGRIFPCATHMLDQNATHIAHILAKLNREGKTLIELSQKAEADYCQLIYDNSLQGRKFFAACTPGYYSNQGEVDVTTKSYSALYPRPAEFFPIMRKLREENKHLDGFEVE